MKMLDKDPISTVRKRGKKALAITVAALMLLALMPFGALAAVTSGQWDSTPVWEIADFTGLVFVGSDEYLGDGTLQYPSKAWEVDSDTLKITFDESTFQSLIIQVGTEAEGTDYHTSEEAFEAVPGTAYEIAVNMVADSDVTLRVKGNGDDSIVENWEVVTSDDDYTYVWTQGRGNLSIDTGAGGFNGVLTINSISISEFVIDTAVESLDVTFEEFTIGEAAPLTLDAYEIDEEEAVTFVAVWDGLDDSTTFAIGDTPEATVTATVESGFAFDPAIFIEDAVVFDLEDEVDESIINIILDACSDHFIVEKIEITNITADLPDIDGEIDQDAGISEIELVVTFAELEPAYIGSLGLVLEDVNFDDLPEDFAAFSFNGEEGDEEVTFSLVWDDTDYEIGDIPELTITATVADGYAFETDGNEEADVTVDLDIFYSAPQFIVDEIAVEGDDGEIEITVTFEELVNTTIAGAEFFVALDGMELDEAASGVEFHGSATWVSPLEDGEDDANPNAWWRWFSFDNAYWEDAIGQSGITDFEIGQKPVVTVDVTVNTGYEFDEDDFVEDFAIENYDIWNSDSNFVIESIEVTDISHIGDGTIELTITFAELDYVLENFFDEGNDDGITVDWAIRGINATNDSDDAWTLDELMVLFDFSELPSYYEVVVFDVNGIEIDETDYGNTSVGTGIQIILFKGTLPEELENINSLTVVVMGDLTGTGYTDFPDLLKMVHLYKGGETAIEALLNAGQWYVLDAANFDGTWEAISFTDLLKLVQIYKAPVM